MIKNNNDAVITRMAGRSLTSNKRRNGILILAVMLSSFMLFTILTVGGTYLRMQKIQNVRMQGGDFDAWLYGGFSEEQKEICENSPDVAWVGAEGFCAWAVSTEYDSTLHSVFVWSDEKSWNTIRQPARDKIEGRYPENENEVMTTREALKDCGLDGLGIGDTFTVTYADNNGEHTKEFTISGRWEGYGDKKTFYVSKSFFDQSGFKPEEYGRGFLYIKFNHEIVTQEMQDRLTESMNLGKKQYLLFTSDTKYSVRILLGLAGLIAVTCLSAYLLIYNIMYLSVSGNVRYYGLLQTVGMTERQIYQLVKKQMLLIGIIGIGAGVILGAAASFGVIPFVVKTLGIRQKDIQITFHPVILLLSILVSGITVYLGSRKPAKMATGISPVEALGYRPSSGRKLSHRTGKGNLLWRMAWEQLGKDKKKTVMVIGALGTCLSFFLCMVTMIQSQGPRTIVSNYMDADLIIKNDTMQMEEISIWKPLIDQEFLKELEENKAIREIHPVINTQIFIPWEPDFMEYWMTEFYDFWMGEDFEDVREDYKQNPKEYYSFLTGIDKTEFEYLNASLEHPVDEEAFLEGKVCILNRNSLELDKKKVLGKTVSYGVYDEENASRQIEVQGMTDDSYYSGLLGTAPTLIVSDSYLKSITDQTGISKVRVQYKQEYDENAEKGVIALMDGSKYKKDFSYESKIEEMEEITKAQGNMMRVGIGITLVLALIGIMNYVNTSVGNLQSRQTELAVMESIGMTQRQMRKMLIREGILFAAGSLLMAMTVGMGITYYLYQSVNYRDIPFRVPLIPVLGVVITVTLVCAAVPLAAYRSLEKKGAIVERIRGFE